MSDFPKGGRTGWAGAAEKAINAWALLGGALLLAVVAMNVISVIGGIVWKPFPGDFELTEIGVAVAVFSFLPYCQMTDSNVSADIFTARASRRTVAFLKLIAAVIAFAFALLLLWRMYGGLLNQREYGYTTAILQVPLWLGYIPILFSLALLAVAACVSLSDHSNTIRKGR